MSNKQNQELIELQAKADEYLAGWKRSLADYENLQKETAKKLAAAGEYVSQNLLLQVLPIYDHFKLGAAHIPMNQLAEDWVKGILHIKKQFDDFLQNAGVTEIKTKGEQFNHNLHQALSYQPSDKPEGEIISEVKAGYLLNGQILQAAQVIVSNNGDKSASVQEEDLNPTNR
ncbi:MAG: nucleotide exchange factor GrpE [Candidatus Komeilibacteria bacterium]|nr:nucleotide exchange factor GrpE [Candidatus Komeilibacteria bacterium]